MGFFDFGKDSGDTRGVDEAERDMDELRTGNTIARKIQGLGIDLDGVDVSFDEGVATLEGEVPDARTREMMILVAGNTPGVARVDDRLRSGGGTATGTDFSSRTYTVQKGDTLSEIAKARLGDASRWKEIFEANRPMLDDPDRIYPGQVLRVPD